MHIRDMHLNDRELAGVQSIEDRDRRVGKGSRVDHNAARSLPRFVDPVNDLMFSVALVKLDLKLKFSANAAAIRIHIREGLIPVDRRLALPEKVQIGAIQDIDDAAHSGFPVAVG
jgi:hypothetical protein